LPSEADKIEKFLNYAEELRVFAGRMTNPKAKALVLSVSMDYERMALLLQKQAKEKQQLG
jgi:hypothetical protein